jgi:hypothetical protein
MTGTHSVNMNMTDGIKVGLVSGRVLTMWECIFCFEGLLNGMHPLQQ